MGIAPQDLVIDHSVQVDYFGRDGALRLNSDMEFRRNSERYRFLKWGAQAFEGLRIVPPGFGICHQVNLEFLARSVLEKDGVLYPDTLVGADSHTPMINGLGVLGWGVGGSSTQPLRPSTVELTHGDVVIAAITSCTNTSNPAVMLAVPTVVFPDPDTPITTMIMDVPALRQTVPSPARSPLRYWRS